MSQSAPAVAYPIARSVRLAGWLLLVAAMGLGALLAWFFWGAPAGSFSAVLVPAVWLLSAAWAGWFWWQSPQGTLVWDGYRWSYKPLCGAASGPGGIRIHLDWQRSLWVRWQADDRSQMGWFWLEQRHAPMQWADLRRALYAPSASSPPTSTP